MIQKNITIRKDQEEFLHAQHMCLSQFVQACLDEKMAVVKIAAERNMKIDSMLKEKGLI